MEIKGPVLNDKEIEYLAESHKFITPFYLDRLNSFGYDLTLSEDFLVPQIDYFKMTVLDPLNMKDFPFASYSGTYCIIPPNSFILSRSVETIVMPPNLTGLCIGRSSYAR